MPRALLMINRKSRSGSADLSEAQLRLEARGIELARLPANCPEELNGALTVHGGGADLVILAGGDGTLNAAAEGLLRCGRPLGILPMGTANDLARTLGIPTDLAGACDVIAQGRTRTIDLGWVNGKHYFNVASIGISAELARALSRDLKRRWGVLGYAIGALRAARDTHPFRASIACDGELAYLRAVQISIGNGRYHGGGMTVAADAAIDDQKLHLYALEPRSLWRLATLLPTLRRGGSPEGIRRMEGENIDISTDHPLPVNTDGEVTTQTPARFRVVARALRVFVPGKTSDDVEG